MLRREKTKRLGVFLISPSEKTQENQFSFNSNNVYVKNKMMLIFPSSSSRPEEKIDVNNANK